MTHTPRCQHAAKAKMAEAWYALGVAYKLGLENILAPDLEQAVRAFSAGARCVYSGADIYASSKLTPDRCIDVKIFVNITS